jgi:4-diphosphocytidyl-2-C-methyl-D-erythritol kinase
MLLFPNAKLNLGLHVVARRPDGFHDLETAFVPIQWCDALEILPAATATPSLTLTGRPIPGDPTTNLCLRAWELLKTDFPTLPAAALHLHKIVPIGAGLGGGSADAAFALRGLNEVFDLGLTPADLLPYARRLGADCAFFLLNEPVLATARGDEFAPLLLPQLAECRVVVVWPGVGIPTVEAFRGVVPTLPKEPLAAVLSRPLASWHSDLINDFEIALAPRYPVLGEVKAALYAAGAAYASLSGSGSAVFGVFPAELPAFSFSSEFAVWQGVFSF